MRYSIVLLVLLVIVGCKTVDDSLKAYDACMGNAACVEAVASDKAVSTAVVSSGIDSFTPTNVGLMIGALVGNVIAFLSGVSRGKRLLKGG